FQLRLKVIEIVVTPDHLVTAAMLDAFDHRGVIEFIREYNCPWQQAPQRRQRRLIRHVARIEQQSRFLAVQIGKLGLEQDVIVIGAGNIAGATRTRPDLVQRLMHGGKHFRVLAHAEIIVGTPDRDFTLTVPPTMQGPRESPPDPANIGEFAITALVAHLAERGFESCGIIECLRHVHAQIQESSARYYARKAAFKPLTNSRMRRSAAWREAYGTCWPNTGPGVAVASSSFFFLMTAPSGCGFFAVAAACSIFFFLALAAWTGFFLPAAAA